MKLFLYVSFLLLLFGCSLDGTGPQKNKSCYASGIYNCNGCSITCADVQSAVCTDALAKPLIGHHEETLGICISEARCFCQ